MFAGRQVPVFEMVQDPKSFIITFPRAYHAGFNYGVCVCDHFLSHHCSSILCTVRWTHAQHAHPLVSDRQCAWLLLFPCNCSAELSLTFMKPSTLPRWTGFHLEVRHSPVRPCLAVSFPHDSKVDGAVEYSPLFARGHHLTLESLSFRCTALADEKYRLYSRHAVIRFSPRSHAPSTPRRCRSLTCHTRCVRFHVMRRR